MTPGCQCRATGVTLKNMISSTSWAFWSLMSHQLWMTGVTDAVKRSCATQLEA